jgi:hypothetical protein
MASHPLGFLVPQVIVADNKGNLGFYNLIQDLVDLVDLVGFLLAQQIDPLTALLSPGNLDHLEKRGLEER